MLISGFFILYWNSIFPLNLAALQEYACDIQHCWPILNTEPKLKLYFISRMIQVI